VSIAVFLDRDGVINKDGNYIHKIEDFVFIDHAIDAMKMIKDKGYCLIVVTNQSGIARGLYTEADFLNLTEWMDWSLMDRGVRLDGIYYCPHHPEGLGEYRCECECRKPKPGMILEGAQYRDVNLSKSYMVGDRDVDMQAGIAAGIKNNYLVRTGKEILDKDLELATGVYDNLLEFAKMLPLLEGQDRAEPLKSKDSFNRADENANLNNSIGASLYGASSQKKNENRPSTKSINNNHSYPNTGKKQGNESLYGSRTNSPWKSNKSKNEGDNNYSQNENKLSSKMKTKKSPNREWSSNASQGDGFLPIKKQPKIENRLVDVDEDEVV
jgi:D-glycero-D-manno-heptose 1,7-bisphosphate phosphatase